MSGNDGGVAGVFVGTQVWGVRERQSERMILLSHQNDHLNGS